MWGGLTARRCRRANRRDGKVPGCSMDGRRARERDTERVCWTLARWLLSFGYNSPPEDEGEREGLRERNERRDVVRLGGGGVLFGK